VDLSQALSSPAASYVIAIPASILVAIILVAIGLAVTRVPRPQIIRRHSGADTYWSVQPEQLNRVEGVLTAEHRPRHYADDSDDTMVLHTEDMEAWETVGRRAVDSPVRHVPVPPHWAPPIGDLRIAILETMTAEYLFVRQPKDQLTPRMVRPYMTADLVG
jgi:hypothetical protein